MGRPKLLDLFCGGGGAAMGYYRAGFDVTGVDLAPQPHFPFTFVQADAMTFPLEGYDVIHASPPCQVYSVVTPTRTRPGHPDLVAPIRQRLQHANVPYIIENVPGAPLHMPIRLCGSMFRLQLQRHRLFELSWFCLVAECRHTERPIGVWGHPGICHRGSRDRHYQGQTADWQRAMGIDWMTAAEMAQAIPPQYTEWIGAQWLGTDINHQEDQA